MGKYNAVFVKKLLTTVYLYRYQDGALQTTVIIADEEIRRVVNENLWLDTA